MIAPAAEWEVLANRVRSAVPEAFGSDGHVLNLIGGEWCEPGHPKPFLSPIDGTLLGRFPMIAAPVAERAVAAAADEFDAWSHVGADVRRERVAACLDQLDAHRDLLAYLLVWEIGKPHRQATVEVDRTLDGVAWYVQELDRLQRLRAPIGLVSNIASWNYPLSVLLHAVLVQALVGNTVIAKTPSDGGLFTLTLAFGIARRCGLPVTLVSGSGGQLSEPLVRHPAIAGVAFVGGKTTGRQVAESLSSRGIRFMIEMEGINTFGIWNYSDWDALGPMIRKGFEYGKQRCTAYTRWVVQRDLFPSFLETYLDVARNLTFGHPLLVHGPDEPCPDVDFGPLINATTAESLREAYQEAVGAGAVMLFRGEFDEARFLPDQDTSAYFRPVALLGVPRNCTLYHSEPFGPVDSFVVVDRPEEMIAEMNVSNGALVASIACDDTDQAARLATELRAFKVGINRVRSRGDRDEAFGGLGESWKGCFVGGEHLVRALTTGPDDAGLYGNFPDHQLLPEAR